MSPLSPIQSSEPSALPTTSGWFAHSGCFSRSDLRVSGILLAVLVVVLPTGAIRVVPLERIVRALQVILQVRPESLVKLAQSLIESANVAVREASQFPAGGHMHFVAADSHDARDFETGIVKLVNDVAENGVPRLRD